MRAVLESLCCTTGAGLETKLMCESLVGQRLHTTHRVVCRFEVDRTNWPSGRLASERADHVAMKMSLFAVRTEVIGV